MLVKFDIDPKRTAILVIDMQRAFCDPEGPIYVEKTEDIIPNIQELTSEARKINLPIIYIRHVLRGDGSDTGRLKEMIPRVDEILKEGSRNTEITSKLTFEADDVIVDKPFYGGFTGTDLDTVLRGKGIDTIIISGTVTNVCCETTARQAVEKEYKVIFLSDATAARDRPDVGFGAVSAEEIQRVTLTTLASNFCQVSPTEEIVNEIKDIKLVFSGVSHSLSDVN